MATFAVGASAAFTDQEEISYDTAVSVLTGLGVINGYSDGSFRPTDSVTRGAFAKMTAYVMNGGTNAASSYGTAAATAFSDVAADSTFGNSIGFCTSKGIISGYTDGTFRAANKVTGVQAAKMLLGALGYSSDIEGYTGTNWSLNVLNDAEDAGLFTGMSSVDLTQPLTREQAAQMIWNAMQATMVKYATGGVSITTPDGTQVSTGASAAEPVANTADSQFKANSSMELVEKYFPNLQTGASTNDEYGRPGIAYRLGTKTIATAIETPAVSYTSTVTAGKVYSDLSLSATATAIPTVVNAGTVNDKGTTTLTKGDNKTAVGGNGIVTEVFVNADGTPKKIVEIAPVAATVLSVSSRNATRTSGAYTQYGIDTTGDNSADVTIKVYSSVVNADNDKDTGVVNGTVAKGDTVLFYKTTATNYVTALTPVTGAVTAKTSAGVYTIGGAAYELAAAAGDLELTVKADAQTVYVDEYGYIVAGKASTEPTAEYGMIVKADYSVSLTNGKLDYVYTLSVAKPDGEVVALNVAVDTYKKYADNAAASVITYAYDSTNGVYVVKSTETENVTSITKGSTTIASGLYGNASTKFIFANTDTTGLTGTVNTVTGVANVGTYNTVTAVALDLNNDNIADVVYVTSGTETTSVTSLTYVTGTSTTTVDGTVYDVVIDGVGSTITAKTGSLEKGLYSTINVTGGAISGTKASEDKTLTSYTTISYNGGLVFSGSTLIGTASDSTPVYTIDSVDGYAETLSAADIGGGMTGTEIYALTTQAGAVTAIYVVYTSAT